MVGVLKCLNDYKQQKSHCFKLIVCMMAMGYS